MIELLNIDCMTYMAGLKDKAFDLAIVDPPYGINAVNMQMGSAPTRKVKDGSGPAISTAVKLKRGRLNSGGGKLKGTMLQNAMDWDDEKPPKEYFDELRRVSINQIIWGGNYFTDMLPVSRCWVCWDKLQAWENFSQIELAWTSFDSPTKIFKYSNTGGINKETKIHPTQKPLKLYRYLMHHRTIFAGIRFKGMKRFITNLTLLYFRPVIIFPPHLTKLHYIIEIDKDYYAASVKRYNNAIMQQKLF